MQECIKAEDLEEKLKKIFMLGIEQPELKIIKKDGTLESYNKEKIKNAIQKSSERTLRKLSEAQLEDISKKVLENILKYKQDKITVNEIHNIVETTLESVDRTIAASYRNYRN